MWLVVVFWFVVSSYVVVCVVGRYYYFGFLPGVDNRRQKNKVLMLH